MSANYYRESLTLLEQLHTEYPSFSLGRHLATATADYGDIWNMTNKEMFHTLQKYSMELSLDKSHLTHDEYVKNIVKDALDLDSLEDEEE